MTILESIKKSSIAKIFIIVLITWVILAIVFGFTDLQISKTIVDVDSYLGIFGKNYGELPGYGLIGISIAILLGGFINDLKKQKIGALIIIIVGIIMSIIEVFSVEMNDLLIWLSITISVAFFLVMTLNKDWRNYFTIALIIALLALLNPLIIVYVLKFLTGRVRYEDIIIMGESFYTPWFLPPGPSTENVSFPSGHAAMGWMFLPLFILIKNRKWKDPIKILTIISVLSWGFFVAISRVLIGAHYPSDVLFSTSFAAIITILLYKGIYSNKNKIESVIFKEKK